MTKDIPPLKCPACPAGDMKAMIGDDGKCPVCGCVVKEGVVKEDWEKEFRDRFTSTRYHHNSKSGEQLLVRNCNGIIKFIHSKLQAQREDFVGKLRNLQLVPGKNLYLLDLIKKYEEK